MENISKPIFRLTDIERMKPVFLGLKTAEQANISERDFEALFKSQVYKNGCVVLNWTSEGFIELYENLKTKSVKLVELIDLELKK